MIIGFDALKELRAKYSDKKLVLSSGTFDLFHVNHLLYLKEARKYGEVLIVMINNDVRVKASKGDLRPVYPQNDRAAIIDGLKGVDYVFIEPGKNKQGRADKVYAEVFSSLRPDVFVTANEDWNNFKEVVGNTKLIVLPRIARGYHSSTSAIIEYIKQRVFS